MLGSASAPRCLIFFKKIHPKTPWACFSRPALGVRGKLWEGREAAGRVEREKIRLQEEMIAYRNKPIRLKLELKNLRPK